MRASRPQKPSRPSAPTASPTTAGAAGTRPEALPCSPPRGVAGRTPTYARWLICKDAGRRGSLTDADAVGRTLCGRRADAAAGPRDDPAAGGSRRDRASGTHLEDGSGTIMGSGSMNGAAPTGLVQLAKCWRPQRPIDSHELSRYGRVPPLDQGLTCEKQANAA